MPSALRLRVMGHHLDCRSLSCARPNRSVMHNTFDAYIYVSDVDKLATELCAKQTDIVEGPMNRIYRMRELFARDCNGYIIAFGQG